MSTSMATVSTPDGPFTIIERDGAVLASGWTAEPEELTTQIHQRLQPLDWGAPRAELGNISRAVRDYYAGDLAAVDSVAVLQVSAPFRAHAWDVLRTVPPGQPVSYTEYALLAGNPAAVRAAAGACARNAAALFVPCHRVVRSDGRLGGFRWGVDVKARLLAFEAEQTAARGTSAG